MYIYLAYSTTLTLVSQKMPSLKPTIWLFTKKKEQFTKKEVVPTNIHQQEEGLGTHQQDKREQCRRSSEQLLSPTFKLI